ncbi:MAG: acetyltransferase [Kiritimatiellae bacterium]|nr:acetyltransferase [Kiritimatiellia bacterium]
MIIGAGGFGREMFATAREAIGYGEDFAIKGFLDGNPSALDGYEGYPSIIGTPETYEIEENDVFITALGNLDSRRRCAAMIEQRGGEFVSVIHKTASIGPNVKIAAGSFIAHNVVLTADIEIGRHSCVFHGTVIGHDAKLNDYTHIYSLVSIGGGVIVEEGVSVFPGARVVPRVTIGSKSTVGIGSAVIRNVEPGITVFGVPAERLRIV